MSLDKCSRSSSVQHQPLPKSVKVRSTCNACQQAKIRCSHEKPSCRRCQKHNIDCIYSMSRRLGRPAKKKDTLHQDEQLDKSADGRRSQNKTNTAKEKYREGSTDDAVSSRLMEESIDEISIEDSLQTPLFADIVDRGAFSGLSLRFLEYLFLTEVSASDSMDFSPDTWFQDFVSGQPTDPIQDRSFFDPFESSFPSLSAGFKDLAVFLPLPPSSTDASDIPPPAYFPLDYTTTLHPATTAHDIPTDYITTPSTTAPEPIFPPASYTNNPVLNQVDTLLPQTTTDHDPLDTPFHLPDPPFPSDDLNLASLNTTSPLDTSSLPSTSPGQCQCYEAALRELLRANICASRPASSSSPSHPSPSTIDAILTCQRGLQQLAETVLQCGLCSRTRVNLLIVIIVSIDSLLSSLEASTTCSTNQGMGMDMAVGKTGLFDPLSDEEVQLPGFDPISIPLSGRRCKDPPVSLPSSTAGGAASFKAQIEACPLVVGGFQIPLDEKCCFIKQLLHSRLSGLLATIRRIRFCTQQVLATSSSRGRLIMMMETDRRLQVIMMRIKMLSR